MKSVKGVVRDARKALGLLTGLFNEVGAYANDIFSSNTNRMSFQCDEAKLKSFAERNGLELKPRQHGNGNTITIDNITFYHI